MSTAEADVRTTMGECMTPEERTRADAIMKGWLAFNANAKAIEAKSRRNLRNLHGMSTH